ncbi:SHOCT domain-containing protein [Chloroflexota bacterium]
MWCFGEGFSWWPWFGGLWMLLFWGVIIGLLVWGITRIVKGNSSRTNENALDIAKARYARGEINKEEFEQIKKDLY